MIHYVLPWKPIVLDTHSRKPWISGWLLDNSLSDEPNWLFCKLKRSIYRGFRIFLEGRLLFKCEHVYMHTIWWLPITLLPPSFPSFPPKIILLRAITSHELLHVRLTRRAEDPGLCSQQMAGSVLGVQPLSPWVPGSPISQTCCQKSLLLLPSAPTGASQNIAAPDSSTQTAWGIHKGSLPNSNCIEHFLWVDVKCWPGHLAGSSLA